MFFAPELNDNLGLRPDANVSYSKLKWPLSGLVNGFCIRFELLLVFK